jgi:TolB-like protein
MLPAFSAPSGIPEPFSEAHQTGLPQPADVRAQLQKILESTLFSKCERLTRFISFAAQHSLTGARGPLKEYVIGIEVFDRTSGYDPRIDPIVRVEARRLRSKLESYYASVGREDPVLVEFPKGTYAPVFRARTPPQAMLRVVDDPTSQLAMTVLPFAPLTANGLDNRFAAGLTEEIVHGLTNVQRLRVVPWNAVEQSNERLDNRGKIDALLRGSVRWESRRVRVISQFIDASSQAYLWSEAYDLPGRNVLSAQHIAKAIVARVGITLTESKQIVGNGRRVANSRGEICFRPHRSRMVVHP